MTKEVNMSLQIPASLFDIEEDVQVCVFCDNATTLPYCALCQEYKGLMTIDQWEAYTGEVWEA